MKNDNRDKLSEEKNKTVVLAEVSWILRTRLVKGRFSVRMKPWGKVLRQRPSMEGDPMKLSVSLSAVIGFGILVPKVICQDDQKRFAFHTPSANVSFAADSILRQDPEAPLPKHYASLVQLRGNVQIRTCCVQSPTSNKSKNPPKQVVTMRADEADFDQETGEMEVRGNVHVNFRNYPN